MMDFEVPRNRKKLAYVFRDAASVSTTLVQLSEQLKGLLYFRPDLFEQYLGVPEKGWVGMYFSSLF